MAPSTSDVAGLAARIVGAPVCSRAACRLLLNAVEKCIPGNPRIDPPMRLSIDHADGGHSGLRIPLIDPKGQHAFLVPNPSADFDNDQFLVHMVARFLSSGGKELSDEPCMATSACSWIPPLAPPHQ